MPSLKITTILGFTGLILFASPVMAEEVKESKVTVTQAENTQVLAAVETAGLIPVQDENGNTFFNHYVTEEELLDTSTDVEVVDTFTFEHNGRLYTNKIVAE